MWKFLLTLCAVVHLCQGRLPELKSLCRDPFVAVGDQCLSFDSLDDMSQEDARQMCQSLGGDLAAFLTAAQFKNVVDYIYSHGYGSYNFWIDGSDSGHEGKWLTSDGQSLPLGTPFWHTTYYSKEPNNELGSENCIELRASYLYYQNDKDCGEKRKPICEMKSERTLEPATPARSCPPLFVPLSNYCVAFVTWEEKTWDEARHVCREMGGGLATIDDIELLREIYRHLRLESISDHSFWTGGYDIGHEGSWLWNFGQPISMGSPFWGRIKRGDPQQPDGGTAENCLYLDHNGGHYFFDGDCDLLLNPLCMI